MENKKVSFKIMFPLYLIFISLLVFSVRNFKDVESSSINIFVIHKIISISLIIFLLFYFFIKNLKLRLFPKFFIFYLLYLFSGLISSLLFSTNKGYAVYKLTEVFAVILVVEYFYYLSKYKKEILYLVYKKILQFYMLLIILSVIGIFIFPSQALRPPTLYGNALLPVQLFGTLVQINADGLGMLAAIVFFVYWVKIFLKKEVNIKNIFWFFLSVIILILAQSRTSIIGVFFVIFLILLFNKEQNLFFKLIIISILILGVVFTIDLIISYLTRGLNEQQIQNLSGRKIWWLFAINEFNSWDFLRQFFGSGFISGSRMILTKMGHPEASTLHSDYIDALVSTGIFGVFNLILFVLSVILFLLRNFFKLIKNIELIELTGIVLILIIRSFFGPTIASHTFFLILFFIVILIIYEKIKEIKFV